MPCFKGWCARSRWCCVLADAVRTDAGGVSAEVCGFARSAIGIGPPEGGHAPSCEGRFAAAIIELPGCPPVCCASVYGFAGAGVGLTNCELWKEVGCYCAMMQRQCVIGGDWQVTAGELMGTGFSTLLGATVLEGSVGVPTCTTANGSSFIDFFVVSNDLAAGARDQVTDMRAIIPTHRPVGFSLQCDIGNLTSRAHKCTVRLPTEQVYGPRAKEFGLGRARRCTTLYTTPSPPGMPR